MAGESRATEDGSVCLERFAVGVDYHAKKLVGLGLSGHIDFVDGHAVPVPAHLLIGHLFVAAHRYDHGRLRDEFLILAGRDQPVARILIRYHDERPWLPVLSGRREPGRLEYPVQFLLLDRIGQIGPRAYAVFNGFVDIQFRPPLLPRRTRAGSASP